MSPPDRPTILHVVEGPTEASSELDRAIAQAGFDVEHVETVYGAMARLVRPLNGPIRAVIVCVDALDAPDLEFFTLAARRRPNVPVYVHGQSVDPLRRQRALALGAQSEVSANHIATVLTALDTDRPVEVQERPVEAPVDVPPPAASGPAAVAEEPPVPSPPETVESDDRVRDEDAAEPAPGRTTKIPTPWEPAANGPRRIPPRANTRAEADEVNVDMPKSEDASAQPLPKALLSPQEVDALLSELHLSEHPGDAADNESA